jgi:hypothetical protein
MVENKGGGKGGRKRKRNTVRVGENGESITEENDEGNT